MEAATWVGPNIMRTSKALGLRTEASARFEKQLHPELAIAAQRLAAKLMVELCGARLVPGTLDAHPRPAEPRQVELRIERLERLLGERVPPEQVEAILGRLGFDPVPSDGRVSVTVPPWRDSDVQREVDLIEEVARIHGLEKLPTTLPSRRHAVGALTPAQTLRRRLEDVLRDRGLHECIAYSFVAPATLATLRVPADGLRIDNPLTEELSVMRPLLLPGLLDAARHNTAHGNPDVALFESAHVYRPAGGLEQPPGGSPAGKLPADENHQLGVLLTRALPATWRSPEREADFFAVRALLDALMDAAGVEWQPRAGADTAFLHPGRSARVAAGEADLGWIGEIHPAIASEWDLDSPVAGFEIDFDAIAALAAGPAYYADVTTFPGVRQDIAVVLPEDVSAARAEAAVRAGGGELLTSARVFDVYTGEQVGEGKRSLALRLVFRAPDRTLTDEEAAGLRADIERELAALGGRLRA
jgi:phenylalanyl-tRNA synthetase beta chain